jgi:hypothetical protein
VAQAQVSAAANAEVILSLPLQFTGVVRFETPGLRDARAIIQNRGGKISVNLPAESYKNAEIALFSVNGKLISRGKAGAYKTGSGVISMPNVARGVYALSVTGADGAAFSSRLVHDGGKLEISVSKTASSSRLVKETAGGDWNITVSSPGYVDSAYLFSPAAGQNPRQTITLRMAPMPYDSTGFEPEMLGIGVGATVSEVRFVWYSDSTAVNNKSFARVFDANGAVVSEDSGEARGASKGKRYHKAAGKGLLQNAEYGYSVSNKKIDWSRKPRFKPPGSGAFTFAIAGDMHQGYIPDPDSKNVGRQRAIEGWSTTMNKISARDVNFVASVGDHVDTADHDDFYKPFFAPAPMQNIPLAAAMGNHDINDLFVYHFNLPNTASRNLIISYSPNITWYGSYWYLYNNALFVVLNTGAYLIKSAAAEKLAEAQAHVNYFDTVIAKAKNAHSGKYDWLIVQHHKSTESVGAHALDEEIQLFKQAGFEPLMDKHGVDLVFAGHDHIYARTKPMKAGSAVASGGTVYLTLPTASYTKFYPEESSLTKGEHIAKYKKNNWNGWPGYGIVNVNGKAISAIIYNYNTDGGADVGLDTLSLSK